MLADVYLINSGWVVPARKVMYLLQIVVMTVLRCTVQNPDREDHPGVDMQHVEHVSLCWCHLSPVPTASRPTLLRAHRTSSWCVSMNSTSLCTVYDRLHQHHPNTVNQSIILIQEKTHKTHEQTTALWHSGMMTVTHWIYIGVPTVSLYGTVKLSNYSLTYSITFGAGT